MSSLLYRASGLLILALALPFGASAGPVVKLSTASLIFANRATGTSSTPQTVTITNIGDATLTIASINQTGSSSGDFVTTSFCGVFVAAGASCNISVFFTPSVTGLRTASLVIYDNAGDSPQTITLTGTGTVAGPVAVLSPLALTFGNQVIGTSSASQTITLANNGTAVLNSKGYSVGGPPPVDFAVTSADCLYSVGGIGVNGSCQFSVTFKPSGPGTKIAVFQIADDSPDSPHKITMTGTGTTAPPSAGTAASTYHVFPQVADGYFADGSYFQSTVLVTNSNPNLGLSSCTLSLRAMALNGQDRFSFNVGTTFSFATPGNASALQSGYASLQCSSNVEAQLLFALYTPAGTKVSEATVFSSPSASFLRIVADHTGGSHLGLAIANDSVPSGSYTLRVYDVNGNLIGAPALVIPGGQNRAVFLDQLLTLPQNYQGYVDILASGASASVIGLKFTGNTFTTVPASIMGPASVTANTGDIFPQIADGSFDDGSYFRSTLVVSTGSTVYARCTLQLHGLTVNGQSQIAFFVNGEFTFASPGNAQKIQTGYASLQCDQKVDAQLLYSFYTADGTKLSEATVFPSPPSASLRVVADYRGGSRLGLAIANDSSQSAGYTVRAYDAGGNVVGSATVTVGANQSRSAFLDDLVTLPGNYNGYLDIIGNGNLVSAIGLNFTGNTFTTIPAVVVAQ